MVQGKQSIAFENTPYITASASIVGTKEVEGPLGSLFDMVGEEDHFGADNWENAESSLQKDAVFLALKKGKMAAEDIRYLFAGDLLGQSIASSFGLMSYQIPMFGLYGACSTCGESLGLGAMTIASGYATHVLCVTSSHFASAEKEFRFPLEYGNQRPLSASWTVTGSGAFILTDMKYAIEGKLSVRGKITGIITGDLGTVGQTALLDLLREKGIDIAAQHMNCGIEMFDQKSQDTHAGGSGCGCAATVLSAYILKQIEEGAWKRVLFVPTGALLSKRSFNEGQTVPYIAHGVVIESADSGQPL